MAVDFIITACNVATLLVLVCTAIAAVVQYRHVRTGNELQAILAIERAFAGDELQTALMYVQDELPARLTDAAYRWELAARGYVDSRRHPEMVACNWFNEMGTLIAGRFVNEAMFLDSFGRLVDYYWKLLAPVIALLRRERGSGQYDKFEYLAYLAQRRQSQERGGLFPRGTPRLPLNDPWLAVDADLTVRTP